MLEPNPDNRPTAKEAMNHPWFLDQMSEAEKKNHIIAQRHQTNLLKTHELYCFFCIFVIFFKKNNKNFTFFNFEFQEKSSRKS